jgi:sulfotransferase 6B1
MILWDDLVKKSALLRRSNRLAKQVPRMFGQINISKEAFAVSPPIIANSVPKSGTHLLNQIVAPFAKVDYETFFTSVPSFPHREIPKAKMLSSLARVIPGEMISAHLHYVEEYERMLESKNAVHYFIYRDPRDIVVSEAHYLTHINTWHQLHAQFKALPSDEARISLAILGNQDPHYNNDYPDVAGRYRKYAPWIGRESCFAVRYEDLVSETRETIIAEMVDFYAKRVGHKDRGALVRDALVSIDPHKSFTYRQGKSGGWRSVLSEKHKVQLKEVAGDLLIHLGYEQSLNW